MNMKKLINVIAKLQVGKNHKNDFGKYNYRNAEDILQGLKPLMVEYGVLVTIADTIELVGDRYYVKATVKCFDAEDGSLLAENAAYAREALNKKGMDEAQVTGSASSYARKYALGGMFNLEIVKDSDEIAAAEAAKKAEEEKKAREYRPLYTHHKVSEMLTARGINPDDFAQVLFGKKFVELAPRAIDEIAMRTEDAIEKYLGADAERPMGE